MNKTDKTSMAQYEITRSTKIRYHYKQYTYENFADALRYAEIDARRTHTPSADDDEALKSN